MNMTFVLGELRLASLVFSEINVLSLSLNYDGHLPSNLSLNKYFNANRTRERE